MTCQYCEYHKQRAVLWRHEAYRLGGTPLPWDADEAIAKAVAAEREACAKVCEDSATPRNDAYQASYILKNCADDIRARSKK